MTRLWLTAAFAAAALMTAPACAQSVKPAGLSADPFSALVGRRAPAERRENQHEAVERYVVAAEDRVFLFQPGEREGRLKFLCGDKDATIDCLIDAETPAEEIYILTPLRGSRGDTIWRNARGQTMLRQSSYGGATIFQRGDLEGLAAAKSYGEDPPLALPPVTLARARFRARQATAIISARIGAPIVFDVEQTEADPAVDARVLGDAIARVAKGIDRVGSDATGAKVIASRIGRVVFRKGEKPALSFNGDVLDVNYNPVGDVEGRPSSATVARFLEESL